MFLLKFQSVPWPKVLTRGHRVQTLIAMLCFSTSFLLVLFSEGGKLKIRLNIFFHQKLFKTLIFEIIIYCARKLPENLFLIAKHLAGGS